MNKRQITIGSMMTSTIAAFPLFYLTVKFEQADHLIAAVGMAVSAIIVFANMLDWYAVEPILPAPAVIYEKSICSREHGVHRSNLNQKKDRWIQELGSSSPLTTEDR